MVTGYLGRNFFTLDIGDLRQRLAVNPWIAQVSIARLWPDSLTLRFQERTVFGHWGQNELVDVDGERFRPLFFRQLRPWPRLAGPDGHEKTLIRTYREANVMVESVDLKIIRLVKDRRRAWWMKLANGIEVKLGREDFRQRLQRFVAIYPRVLSERSSEIATVDLRYISGFAVRWKTAG